MCVRSCSFRARQGGGVGDACCVGTHDLPCGACTHLHYGPDSAKLCTMNASTITISSIAGEAYDWFTRQERGDETITVLKDGAPEWLSELVHEAHGEFLPDDWRYASIRRALGEIHDASAETADELEDLAHEFADGNIDTYNANRTAWLASNLNRAGYVDEAVEEFGHSDQGVYGDIGLGQYAELEEVFASVRQSLADRLEEVQDADDES